MIVMSSLDARMVSLMVLTEVPRSSFKSHKKEMNDSIASFASVGIGSSSETIKRSISDSRNCSLLPYPPTATRAI